MNDYLISWRPSNILTIGLMLLIWVLGYALISQGVRRVAAARSDVGGGDVY